MQFEMTHDSKNLINTGGLRHHQEQTTSFVEGTRIFIECCETKRVHSRISEILQISVCDFYNEYRALETTGCQKVEVSLIFGNLNLKWSPYF